MVNTDIKAPELSNELQRVMSLAQQQLPTHENLIKSIICPIFDKEGYMYTVNPNNGNFTIKVDEFSNIHGYLTSGTYQIELTTSIDGISAKSQSVVYLALIDFSYHIPFFNALIEGARNLASKFHEQLKLKKSAELVSVSSVQPVIDKLKLKATLIAPDDESGTVIVRMPICNNFSIQTRVNLDNSEQRCRDLAVAHKYVSQFFPPKLKKLMTFHRYPVFDDTIYRVELWDKLRTCVYQVDFKQGTYTGPWDLRNGKMEYQNATVIKDLIPNERQISKSQDVNLALNELGFQYYVSEGRLVVFVNDDYILVRDESNNKVLFQQYSKQPIAVAGFSRSKTMPDAEFIKLLKMIAINPTFFDPDNYFGSCKADPNDVLKELFISILPENWSWVVKFYGGPLELLVDKKYWLTLPRSSGQFVNAIWALVSNQDFFNNLSTPLPDKPHIKMYIEKDFNYVHR